MAVKRPQNSKRRKKAAPKDESTDEDWMVRDLRIALEMMGIHAGTPDRNLSNPTPKGPSGPRVEMFSHDTPLNLGGRGPNAPVGGRMPEFGNIVSCFFPEDDRPDQPGIKARPCLVLHCRRAQSSFWWITVAYGTTNSHDEIGPGEFTISTAESLKPAGLHYPTKFMTTRFRTVPFNFAFFRANREGSVFLGALSVEDRARAQEAWETGRRQRPLQDMEPEQQHRH